MFYVYKYENDKKEIGYIGLTNDLNRRIQQHLQDKVGLSEYGYVYYFECETEQQMKFYEYALINKYLPPLNVADKQFLKTPIIIAEPEWKPYGLFENKNEEKEIKSKQKQAEKITDILKKIEQRSSYVNEIFPTKNKYYIFKNETYFEKGFSAFNYKVLNTILFKYQKTGCFCLTALEFCRMAGITDDGQNYNNFKDSIQKLKELQIIEGESNFLKKQTIFQKLPLEKIFQLINFPNLGKYEWFFLELFLIHDFKDFAISAQDLRTITGLTTNSLVKRLALPKKIQEIFNLEIEISDIKVPKGKTIEGFLFTFKSKEKESGNNGTDS